MNPFAKPRPNPKRREPRRTGDRIILHGEAKTQRRREIFERSGGRCEAYIRHDITEREPEIGYKRCNRPITWESMHLSHLRHGAYRDDRNVIASCAECHEVGVHNPKAVPRKPGRTMNIKEANEYWHGQKCWCERAKKSKESFCSDCSEKISRQLLFDLEHTTGKDYLKALGLAELELLAWRPAEEQTCK